ncbi:MAG: two-component system, sensor histidine kinase [Thiomicrorhabdus sp.]|nr:MAG: two-component system, sensor histidine kinase [Thiomicrorhabdus sp.]
MTADSAKGLISLHKRDFASELMAEALWWRYSCDQDYAVVEISPTFQALFERPIKVLTDLTGPYTSPIINIKIKAILDAPESDVRFASSYDTIHGKRSFQHQLKVYENQGKRYVWSNCIDVSERVELEREIVDAQGRLSVSQLLERQMLLEEQNRFISESYQKQSHFLAMLSHELRSPLLGISSLVERLRAKENDPDILTALKTIHITAEQSTFLVNDILTYSQTEYSEITLHPVQFSLKETLENVKQLTKSIATDKGLIVSLIYLGVRDKVMGDSVRLSQILINLIINSIKFTQYGGVTIEVTQQSEDHFSFKVTDSGEGIAEDQLEHIFEPFAQLDSHGSAFNIGSGLGLLVVKKLVALMGGSIKVESTLDVGTSFSFHLIFNKMHPSLVDSTQVLEQQIAQGVLKHESFEQHVHKSSIGEKKTKNKAKVLVADDSKINRMVLSGFLEELDCTVIEAKNGKHAWELFQANCFEYVFLDIQMPFMDGIEVSKRIQQHELDSDISTQCLKGVFAVTAGGSESEFIPYDETLESIGFDCWFVKPVSQSLIVDLLRGGSQRAFDKADRIFPTGVEWPATKDVVEKVETQWDSLESVPEQFHSLIEPFMAEMKLGLKEIMILTGQEDWPTVAAKAHYLKGNCMLFQLNQLIELFRKLENVAKSTQKSGNKLSEIKFIGKKLILGVKYLEKSSLIGHNIS